MAQKNPGKGDSCPAPLFLIPADDFIHAVKNQRKKYHGEYLSKVASDIYVAEPIHTQYIQTSAHKACFFGLKYFAERKVTAPKR